MVTKHLIDPADIRFSSFRLPHENLSSGGKGCLVYHIPTKQTAMSEVNQPYPVNKKVALKELAKMLGIEEELDVQKLFPCKACGQEIVPDFPEWKRVQTFVRECDAFRISVYFMEGIENDALTGWTWDLDARDPHQWQCDDDDELYETPEGAIRAANKWWALATTPDDVDQEGEISTLST